MDSLFERAADLLHRYSARAEVCRDPTLGVELCPTINARLGWPKVTPDTVRRYLVLVAGGTDYAVLTADDLVTLRAVLLQAHVLWAPLSHWWVRVVWDLETGREVPFMAQRNILFGEGR